MAVIGTFFSLEFTEYLAPMCLYSGESDTNLLKRGLTMYSIKALTRESDWDETFTNANGPAVYAKCDWRPDEPVCKMPNQKEVDEVHRGSLLHYVLGLAEDRGAIKLNLNRLLKQIFIVVWDILTGLLKLAQVKGVLTLGSHLHRSIL